EGESLLDDLFHPKRFADARAAHVAAGLAQLAAREEPEGLAVAVKVAAQRVHLLGAARNQLLHHGFVRRGGLVGTVEIGCGLTAKELAPMAAPEADVRGRLDDQRAAERLAGLLCERAKRGDEAVLVVERIGRQARLRVPRPEAERERPVVDREHAKSPASERADRREPVHPGDLDDHGRALTRHPRESSYAPEEAV